MDVIVVLNSSDVPGTATILCALEGLQWEEAKTHPAARITAFTCPPSALLYGAPEAGEHFFRGIRNAWRAGFIPRFDLDHLNLMPQRCEVNHG